MKTRWNCLILALLSLAGLTGLTETNAYAIERTGWERPVLKARMEVLRAQPQYASVRDVELVMTKQDGVKDPTGFVLLIDGQQMDFEVVKTYVANCGDTGYMAAPHVERGQISVSQLRLYLVNRTHQFCTALADIRDRGWQVSISDLNDDLMDLAGMPEPVATIQ